ncbi:nicalin-1-like [Lytechinus variegatus]|uniref:nicalin-1-like n=1 Tax=Lytechinus variegatus TaxID=7654 RepID=UPI001BB29372|nr:nicalin-1-like [Lytechinus variegatus]
MWFAEAEEVVEVVRGHFPWTCLLIVPILIAISPVHGAHDFTAYRMQQFDLHGSQYGCRNTLVNLEARPISAKMVTRRCILARLSEVTADRYRELIEQGAGALVILLPESLTSAPQDVLNQWMELEPLMLEQETTMPVYFASEDEELLSIHSDIQQAVSGDQAPSAAQALLSAVYANGFQMVVSGSQAKPIKDGNIISFQGQLTGKGVEDQLPTLAVVAHYDAFGAAPHLSHGADSNGSGVVALLELARLFSKLYTSSRTHAKYNLLFFLSGGGKFNYHGTKRWIEDQLESQESSLLSDVSYVMCLDTIGASDELYLHVSKPPKEGSESHQILQGLENVTRSLYPSMKFSMVHKRINLADDWLAWEHERFSMQRLPAGTLSHLSAYDSASRSTITDDSSRVDSNKLARNVKIIAETLAHHIFGIGSSDMEVFVDGYDVNKDSIDSWIKYLSSEPRSAQLLTKDQPLLQTLQSALSRHLKDVKRLTIKADKREPEYVFYDGLKFTVHAYNVKPAVFDLFLAAGIASYLGLIYLTVQNFSMLKDTVRSYVAKKPKIH